MKSTDHNLISYSNIYLKLQPSLTSFTPRLLFFFWNVHTPHLTWWDLLIILHYRSQFNNIFIVNLLLSKIFGYRLNLFLCLHLAIKSHVWLDNFSGSGYNILYIISSRHKLHLLSKQFGVLDLFNILHWISGVKPRGVMVKAMDCGIVVSEFVLLSRYFVYFRANTLGKGMNPLILWVK